MQLRLRLATAAVLQISKKKKKKKSRERLLHCYVAQYLLPKKGLLWLSQKVADTFEEFEGSDVAKMRSCGVNEGKGRAVRLRIHSVSNDVAKGFVFFPKQWVFLTYKSRTTQRDLALCISDFVTFLRNPPFFLFFFKQKIIQLF